MGCLVCYKTKRAKLDTNERTNQLAKYLNAALACSWHLNISIKPKLHILEDHLLEVIAHVKTLEYFDEEFVERAHQKGLKYNQITKGMNCDPCRMYNYMVWWEMACAQSALEWSKKWPTLEKRGGKQRKTEHSEARNSSVVWCLKSWKT